MGFPVNPRLSNMTNLAFVSLAWRISVAFSMGCPIVCLPGSFKPLRPKIGLRSRRNSLAFSYMRSHRSLRSPKSCGSNSLMTIVQQMDLRCLVPTPMTDPSFVKTETNSAAISVHPVPSTKRIDRDPG